MLTYWLMYAVCAAGALLFSQRAGSAERVAWAATTCFLALVIGLRSNVGCDWIQYEHLFRHHQGLGWRTILGDSDPAYYLVNWLIGRAGGGVIFVNLVCAAATTAGTAYFAKGTRYPWVALLTAVPYLLIVVAMGYTRQATALGIALVALRLLGSGRTKWFVFATVFAALFHRSAVLLLPVAAVASAKSRRWSVIWVGVIAALTAQLLVAEESEQLWTTYVEGERQSSGGQIRVAMNALPAALFLLFNKRLQLGISERRLWWWMSVLALACVPLVGLASTAVDRVALYFIPLQLYAFSLLPALLGQRGGQLGTLVVVAYYGAVQFTWLNYAVHARCWVPYQMQLPL